MTKVHRQSIEILVTTSHNATKFFVTPSWFKTALPIDAERFIANIATRIREMEKHDEEMEKIHQEKGIPLPTDQQILQFING